MKFSVLLIVPVLLCGCSLLPQSADETKGWSAQQLYAAGKEELNDRNFDTAIKHFENLQARYPYGRYAQQSQLEVAYAYYKDNEPLSAIAAADRFIKLHPNHPNVDYAYYLKGLVNFNEDLGLLGYVAQQDLSERDPKAARESYDAFKELVTRFPQSKYAEDAALRMRYLVNALASHEIHVAKYYYKRGAYLATVNRAKIVLEQYPNTTANEHALGLMVRAYDALGMADLRDDAARVLKQNYPQSGYIAGNSKSAKGAWWKFW